MRNMNFPDIVGNFQQGYAFGAQMKQHKQAEQDDALVRSLAPQAIAGDPSAIARVGAVNPQAAKQYGEMGETLLNKTGGLASWILEAVDRNADPREVEQRYQAGLPLLTYIGAQKGETPSPTFDANQIPAMRALVAQRDAMRSATPTAEMQNFQAMTQGFTPEQIRRAREMQAGVRPRAGGTPMDVPDGKGGTVQMIYDPSTNTFTRPNYGQGQPSQAQPQAHEGPGITSQALGGGRDNQTAIRYGAPASLMNDAANQAQAIANPGGFDALRSAVEWQESRGNPNAVSSAGALGRMQTMPSTLTDPGFGITPARDRSDEEMTRVGNEYLQAMLSRYGDQRLALAAYNAGYRRVDQALQASGGNVDRALSMLPEETQKYVPSVLGRAAGGGFGAGAPEQVAQLGYTPPKAENNIPSGFQKRTDGQPGVEPIPGGPADKSGSNGTPNFEEEQKLRKEFTDYAKNDRTILGMYDKVKTAATQPSAANDLALIFGYMKMLDPGSVVREQEFANAQNAGGVPDRIRAAYNKVLAGERLSESQRADFLRSADGLAQTARESITQSTRKYQGIADASGFDAARATGMADFRDVSAKTLPGASQTGGQAVQVRSEADYNALPSGAMYVAPDGSQRRKR